MNCSLEIPEFCKFIKEKSKNKLRSKNQEKNVSRELSKNIEKSVAKLRALTKTANFLSLNDEPVRKRDILSSLKIIKRFNCLILRNH